MVYGLSNIQIEQDAQIQRRIKRLSRHAARNSLRASSRDLQIHALRIRLRAVGRARRVQGNNLVADNVVAGRQPGRDSDGPGDAIRDERVRGPGARVRARDPAPSIYLNPLQRRFVDGRAVSPVAGDVVDDWAVAGGLGVPLERHLAAGRGCHVRLHVCGGFVADDVGAGKGVWGDEAVVEGFHGQPAVAGTGLRYLISAFQPVYQTPLAAMPVTWPWPVTRGATGRRAARKADRSAILDPSHVRRMRGK